MFLLGLLIGFFSSIVCFVFFIVRALERGQRRAVALVDGELKRGREGKTGFFLEETRVTLQLAGKTKTRQGGVTARVDGTTLILEGVRGTQDVLIDLRGCMVREPPEEFGLQNGIEIIRGEHKLKVGMLEVDYIFLTFSRGAPLRDFWLGSLIANCFCKAATGDDLVSKKERQLADRETAIVHKGVMAVEWGSEGVAQQQMWAVLDALPCLTLYDSASNPTMCVRLYMADTTSCFHVDPEKRRFRVQGVSRPLYHLSQGRISVDYVFLTATQATFASWKSAFESVKPQDRDLNLLDFHARETTNWLHTIMSRFIQSMRMSPTFVPMLKAKMTKKLQQKIEARDLQSSIEDLQVEDLHIPALLPKILFAQVQQSRYNDTLACDFLIDWQIQNDPFLFCVSFTLVINFPTVRWKEFYLRMSVAVHRLFGKLRLECDPFPTSKFSLAFYSMPDVEFSVKHGFDTLPLSLSSRLENFLIAKIKLALLQKLVMPNRKYFPIAKSFGNREEQGTSQLSPPPPIPPRRTSKGRTSPGLNNNNNDAT